MGNYQVHWKYEIYSKIHWTIGLQATNDEMNEFPLTNEETY